MKVSCRRPALILVICISFLFLCIETALAKPGGRNLMSAGSGGGSAVEQPDSPTFTEPQMLDSSTLAALSNQRIGTGCSKEGATAALENLLSEAPELLGGLDSSKLSLKNSLALELEGNKVFKLRYLQTEQLGSKKVYVEGASLLATVNCSGNSLNLVKATANLYDTSRVVRLSANKAALKSSAEQILDDSAVVGDVDAEALKLQYSIRWYAGAGDEFGFRETARLIGADQEGRAGIVEFSASEAGVIVPDTNVAGIDVQGTVQAKAVLSGPVHENAHFSTVALPSITMIDGYFTGIVDVTNQNGYYSGQEDLGLYAQTTSLIPTQAYIDVVAGSGAAFCYADNLNQDGGSASIGCTWNVVEGSTPRQIDFLMNPAPDSSFNITHSTEVTASYHGNRVKNWIGDLFGVNLDVDASPDLEDPDEDMDIRVRSTVAGYCGAEYSYAINTMSLGRAGQGTVNGNTVDCHEMAFDSIIYHEFGHALHDWLGGEYDSDLETPANGVSEGLGDIISAFLLENPRIAEGIIASETSADSNYVRNIAEDHQFDGETDVSGELINQDRYEYGLVWAAIAWDTRADLIQLGAAEGGDAGIEAAKELAATLFIGSMADLPTTIEEALLGVLELDSMRPTPQPCLILGNAESHGVPIEGELADYASAAGCIQEVSTTAQLQTAIQLARTTPGLIAKLAAGDYNAPADIGPSAVQGMGDGAATVLHIVGQDQSVENYRLHGAIAIRGGTLRLKDLTISNVPANNAATFGRAIFAEEATVILERVLIKDNPGGGVATATFMLNGQPSRLTVKNSTFMQNGSRLDIAPQPIDDYVSFYTDRYISPANQTQSFDIEIDFDGAGPMSPIPLPGYKLRNGGAIWHGAGGTAGQINISDSYFLFNQAEAGGAIQISTLGEEGSRLENNIIFGNLAFRRGDCPCQGGCPKAACGIGGAINSSASDILMVHNTIVNNEGGWKSGGVNSDSCYARTVNSIVMYNRRNPAYCEDGSEYDWQLDTCSGDPAAEIIVYGVAPFVRDLHYPECSQEQLSAAVRYTAMKNQYRPRYYGDNWNNPDAPEATPWPGEGNELGTLNVTAFAHLVVNHRLLPGDDGYEDMHNFFSQDLRLCGYASARNAGENASATPYDIRGHVRPLEQFADMGAYEMGASEHPTGDGICDDPDVLPPFGDDRPEIHEVGFPEL